MSVNHPYLNFDEYIRQGESSQKEKALNWETAIGLQAVDGLRVSDYLRETAQKHIEGEISSDEVKRRIKEYYQTKTKREHDDDDNVIQNVAFLGGCNGNLQGICRLVTGQKIDDVINKLEGIRCGNKITSCPDQLCQALKELKRK